MDINKHSIGDIGGHNNNIVNGTQNNYEAPKPKEGIMCNLLNNIANMISNREIHPELPDNLPYKISDKIAFNDIRIYSKFQDYFEDGLYIVETRLKTIEDSSIGNIKPQIFRYIEGFFMKATLLMELQVNFTPDKLIEITEQLIINDLKDHYVQLLSPEDLSHVRFVVYYVFASCKIFLKPTKEFMMNRNANP